MSGTHAKKYMNSYAAGIGLGLVLLAAFVLMGRGLGASGAATRLTSYAVHKVDASVHGGTRADADTAAKRNPYLGKYLAPDRDPLDDFLVYMFLGALVGGLVSGALGRRISLEIIHGPHTTGAKRILFAVLGGLVSAFGARLARGCTSGQALTGGATLALGSWAFMFAVFAGGYALAYFMRKEWI